MLIGLISDIHGNIEALTVVWEKLSDCQKILYAGDITGYYPNANECIDIIKNDHRVTAILGNHDEFHLSFKDRNLSKENFKYLKSLKQSENLNIDGLKIGLFHGGPFDPNERFYPDSDFTKLAKVPFDFLILGHTHYPLLKRVNKVTIVNPGSVGQPRDDDSRASYAILDTKSREVEMHRIEYDVDKVCEKVKENKLDPRLCQILKKS